LGHRAGPPLLCFAIDASHHILTRTKASLLPRSKEILLPTQFFSFPPDTKHKGKKEKETKQRKGALMKADHDEAPYRKSLIVAVGPRPEETQEGYARRRLQEGHDVRHTNDVIPRGDGFSPASEKGPDN
jgi:hypothetical protein